MANVKITELTAATALAGTDVLPIVDVGADATKKVSVSDLLRNLPDGTASAPALAFADDQNSGILSPAENELAFATSGTQRFVIDSSGRVGIGTSSPSAPLTVFGGSASSPTIRIEGGSSGNDNARIESEYNLVLACNGDGDQSGRTIQFRNNATNLVTIDSSGQVGIGTTSPGQLLHLNANAGVNIQGNSRAFFGSQYSDHFAVIGSAVRVDTGQTTGMVSTETSTGNGRPSAIRFGAGAIQFHSATSSTAGAAFNSERMRIDSSGNIGIGTTSPGAALHIESSSADAAKLRIGFDSPRYYDIFRKSSDGSGFLNFYGSQSGFTGYVFGGVDGERMRIDSSGRVLINATAAATNDSFLTVKNGSGACEVNITSGPTSASVINLGDTDDYNIGRIKYDQTNNSLQFNTNNGERMRIDALGNVAIGTTTIGSAPLTLYSSASRTMYQGSSTGTGNGNGFTTGNNGATDAFVWNYENGFMQFATNNTERMRIDNSGRLLVGTSSALDTTAGSIASNNSSSGGRLALGGNPSSAGSSVGEVFGWWNANKVAGLVIASGADTTNKDDGELLFYTSASGPSVQERMRIDSSGRLLVGTTSVLAGTGNTNSGLSFDSASANQLYVSNTTSDNIVVQSQVSSGTVNKIAFIYNSSVVARITCSSTQVNYNTGSDYRLKENVVDIIDGIARVKQLQPRRFNFIADADTTVDGFVAHEAQAVVPEAVTGTHNEVDDNGNAVMQGIDQSKLVPLLTAALKEAIAKIETLETKVAALEAQ